DLHIVLPAWQALAESGDADRGHRVHEAFLESLAESFRAPVEVRAAAAFVAVAPEEFLRARAAPQVAKPHHVGAAGPVGTGHIERTRKVGELSLVAAAAPGG